MESRLYQIVSIYLDLLEKQKKKPGRPEKISRREYFEEIMYVLRTGIQWRNLRGKLHWSSYYKKFSQWAKAKVFSTSFEIIQKILKKGKYLSDECYRTLYVDSSMVKNVRGSDGLGVNHYDRGRKGNKVSLIVTSHGVPLSMKVFGSNVHDVTALSEQIQNLEVKIIGSRVIGDKGYNSRKLRSQLNESGIKLIFPAKKNQKVKNTEEEKSLLKDRNIVENVFSWIQMRRRIKLRYDFYQYSYAEFYCLALSDLIIKKGILA